MKLTVKIEGLRQVEKALEEMPRATAKNVLRRVLLKRAEPFAEDYRNGVDVKHGDLRNGIGVSTKLTKRQARLARKAGKSTVEVYAGAGDDPAAHLEEFGSVNNAPNPAMRQSWERNAEPAVDGIGEDLWAEIDKAAKRQARKAARLAAKG